MKSPVTVILFFFDSAQLNFAMIVNLTHIITKTFYSLKW